MTAALCPGPKKVRVDEWVGEASSTPWSLLRYAAAATGACWSADRLAYGRIWSTNLDAPQRCSTSRKMCSGEPYQTAWNTTGRSF